MSSSWRGIGAGSLGQESGITAVIRGVPSVPEAQRYTPGGLEGSRSVLTELPAPAGSTVARGRDAAGSRAARRPPRLNGVGSGSSAVGFHWARPRSPAVTPVTKGPLRELFRREVVDAALGEFGIEPEVGCHPVD